MRMRKKQLKIAIYNLLFQPDLPLAEYWVLKKVYPDWASLSEEELKKMVRSFDPFYNKIDRVINHPPHRELSRQSRARSTPR